MPTALPDWTTERPEVPGFYWWMPDGGGPEVVEMIVGTAWFRTGIAGLLDCDGPLSTGALWWPVRLEHPPVG